jgi:predicted Zn-dependent protease
MPFARLDSAAIARALSQIADQAGDLADLFLERRERIELPPPNQAPGFMAWRESGLAVRLLRAGRTWLAGRDAIDRDSFRDAMRRVARAMPRAPYPDPELDVEPWDSPPRAPELLDFPSAVQRALRSHRTDLRVELTLRRHRRWVRVIGTRLASGVDRESFYSLRAELPGDRTPGSRFGTLLTDLEVADAERVALCLVRAHDTRDAEPPEPGETICVLGPAAAAVLLHEAVAHALEADTLALTGHPENAVGMHLGTSHLNVFDDPSSAPRAIRRTSDDEGFPVVRRCLLRGGVVEQPLADTAWSQRSEILTAGAGRRGNRHLAPGPRSTHLELAPGELSRDELLADAEGGLYLPQAERGALDPLSGVFTLWFPWGRRIREARPGEPVGRCMLRGQVGDLLSRVTGCGREVRFAGAGWCAKDGVKLPVWATAPELRLDGVEILP